MQISSTHVYVAPKTRVADTDRPQNSPRFGNAAFLAGAGLVLAAPALVASKFRQRKQAELERNVPLFVEAAFLANGVRFQECRKSGAPVEAVSVAQDRKGNLAVQTDHYLISLNGQYVKTPEGKRTLISPISVKLRWKDKQTLELLDPHGVLLGISIPAFPSLELLAFLKDIFKRYQFEKSLLPERQKAFEVVSA